MKTNAFSIALQRRCLPILGIALALFTLLLPVKAQSQLTFTLNPGVQQGLPGDTLTFTGTLTNISTSELFLNTDLFTLEGDDLTLDDTPFFTHFPLSLAGGATASGDLFTVTIDPSAPGGIYSGTFSILGGIRDTDTNELALQYFGVAVVPEPGTCALLLCSALMIGIVKVRWKRIQAIGKS